MNASHLRRAALVALVTACGAVPMTVRAQARAIQVGIGAGVTLPTGDYSECCKSGWNAGGFLQYRQPDQVVGLRVDLQYHGNDMKDEFLLTLGATPGTTGSGTILFGGAAGVLEVAPQESSVGWYLLAGGGIYQFELSVNESGISVSDSQTKFGFNAGAGLKFRVGGASLYVESRYHGVKVEDSNITFVPLSFGIAW